MEKEIIKYLNRRLQFLFKEKAYAIFKGEPYSNAIKNKTKNVFQRNKSKKLKDLYFDYYYCILTNK